MDNNYGYEITSIILKKSSQEAGQLREIIKKSKENKEISRSDRIIYRKIERAYKTGDFPKALSLAKKLNKNN